MVKVISVAFLLAALVYVCHAECGIEVMDCVNAVTQAIGKDPENKEAICKAYNDMKDCVTKAGCDFKEATKNMSVDIDEICGAAGVVKVSIIVMFMALLASYFTK